MNPERVLDVRATFERNLDIAGKIFLCSLRQDMTTEKFKVARLSI